MGFLGLYIGGLVLFVLVDGVWLGLVAKGFYRDGLGPLIADKPNLPVAALFYLIYPAGLVIFGMRAGVTAGDWRVAAGYGGLFGAFAYLTYDLTNLATIKGFPAKVAIVDSVWGALLSAFVSGAVVAIALAREGA